MSDASSLAKSLRERFGGSTEDRLGKALSELLESPLLTGALGRAFDAREKAAQAQELAMGALNIPSAADIERLTRRLRSVSYRLEGIEDGVGRLDRALASGAVGARLSAIEEQLDALAQKIKPSGETGRSGPSTVKTSAATRPSGKVAAAKRSPGKAPAAKRSPGKASAAKRSPGKAPAAKRSPGKAPAVKRSPGKAPAAKRSAAAKATPRTA